MPAAAAAAEVVASAEELWADAAIASGRAAVEITRLRRASAAQPHREVRWRQLVGAAGCGGPADGGAACRRRSAAGARRVRAAARPRPARPRRRPRRRADGAARRCRGSRCAADRWSAGSSSSPPCCGPSRSSGSRVRPAPARRGCSPSSPTARRTARWSLLYAAGDDVVASLAGAARELAAEADATPDDGLVARLQLASSRRQVDRHRRRRPPCSGSRPSVSCSTSSPPPVTPSAGSSPAGRSSAMPRPGGCATSSTGSQRSARSPSGR